MVLIVVAIDVKAGALITFTSDPVVNRGLAMLYIHGELNLHGEGQDTRVSTRAGLKAEFKNAIMFTSEPFWLLNLQGQWN